MLSQGGGIFYEKFCRCWARGGGGDLRMDMIILPETAPPRLKTPRKVKLSWRRFSIRHLNRFWRSTAQKNRNKIPHTTMSMHFSFFRFSENFGQLKFDGSFVNAKKIGEIQNSKMHRHHTVDHIILKHVISSDSSERQPSFWDRARGCGA